jgi:hypothetical protein
LCRRRLAEHGGGIFAHGEVSLTQSTVTDNRADLMGGGVYQAMPNNRPFSISGSIVAGNTAGIGWAVAGPISSLIPTVRSANYSLIGDKTGTSLVEAPIGSPDTNGNLIGGPANGAIDPLLGPLADKGGPTMTHALLAGSPAIDAGDPGIALNPAEYDQRGAPFVRVFDGNSNGVARIDVGAYELQPDGMLGDYNRDGGVNAADYVMWRKLFGTSFAPPFVGADGDGDSSIDPGDYDVWTEHFGEALPGSGGSEQSRVESRGSSAGVLNQAVSLNSAESGPGAQRSMPVSETLAYVAAPVRDADGPQSARRVRQESLTLAHSRSTLALSQNTLALTLSQGERGVEKWQDRALVAWLDSRASERSLQTVPVDGDFFQRESDEATQESMSDDIDAVFEEMLAGPRDATN